VIRQAEYALASHPLNMVLASQTASARLQNLRLRIFASSLQTAEMATYIRMRIVKMIQIVNQVMFVLHVHV
jgi:hypothetical protein